MNSGTMKAEGQNESQGGVLRLVPRSVGLRAVADEVVLREGSTGCAVAVLSRVWAVGEHAATLVPGSARPGLVADACPGSRPKVELAFYRKYSEAMLRRYLRMSMEAGRVPSLLGREMFRGNVTSYRVHSFEDVVVFCLDVERCLAKLSPEEKRLIRRIALQEYTHSEAAAVLGMSLRTLARQYGAALDKVTALFLTARLLEPLKGCQ